MSFVNTCADNLRIAIADLEALQHSRTKESFAKVKGAILKRMTHTADMLEGQFEIVDDEPKATKKAAPKRLKKVVIEAGATVLYPDFKARAKAEAESVFKK
jgi:hypothetical protein